MGKLLASVLLLLIASIVAGCGDAEDVGVLSQADFEAIAQVVQADEQLIVIGAQRTSDTTATAWAMPRPSSGEAQPATQLEFTLRQSGLGWNITDQRPRSARKWSEYAFLGNYRATHYLELAAQLQKVDAEARATQLRELANDFERGSEIHPLCRMLFVPKGKPEFRPPLIGGPQFLGKTTSEDWPLQPIALYEGVPFLVVWGYVVGGVAETPERYLEYCLSNCVWREEAYEQRTPEQLREIAERFIAAHPKLEDYAAFIRMQVE